MSPILSLRNITKRYNQIVANQDISLDVYVGKVHALVGENGAGKSTLMKIIFGLEEPDQGDIFYRGQTIKITSPKIAKNLKIAMVHQHFMLAENLSVEDHLRLEVNAVKQHWGVGPYRQLKPKINELARRLGLTVPLTTLVSRLSVIQKQKLEILKTLLFDPEIIIFDEPTAVLPPAEVAEFYRLVADLRARDLAIIIITHKLFEVMNNADTVSVLRFGKLTFRSQITDTTANEIAKHMVGEALTSHAGLTVEHDRVTSEHKLLQINNFSVQNHTHLRDLKTINLQVKSGEIVAFAGVEGNGQSELLKCILLPEICDACFSSGDIQLLGHKLVANGKSQLSHTAVRKMSVGYIGEDRLNQSAISSYYLEDHYRLLPHHRDSFWLKSMASGEFEAAQIKFDIRPTQLSLALDQFSGGNQQKWVVARETSFQPDLLIASHPTRGVDFAAARKIHNSLIELRNAQKGVILLSSDLDEILDVADRILIFYKGQMTGEFARPFARDLIGEAMGGARANS